RDSFSGSDRRLSAPERPHGRLRVEQRRQLDAACSASCTRRLPTTMSVHRKSSPESTLALPPGTPAWITPELVQLTLSVWQPYYDTPLTVADAVTILMDVGRLLGELTRG